MRKALIFSFMMMLIFTLMLPSRNISFADEASSQGVIQVKSLTTEYMKNPLGIDVMHPRLSWKMKSHQRAQMQTAYRVLVASSKEKLSHNVGDVWDTGKVKSDQSANVVYQGPTLKSGHHYYWKVRVWDQNGNPSSWSKPAMWSMGLLDQSEWKGQWISLGGNDQKADPMTLDGVHWIWYPEGNPASSAPADTRYFRYTFNLPADRSLKKARFLGTADDHMIVYVNGAKVGEGNSWKQAKLFDITDQLQTGKNTIAISATNGSVGPAGLIGRMEIDFEQGDPIVIDTGSSWKVTNEEQQGWQQPDFDASSWKSAMEIAMFGGGPWGSQVNTSGGDYPAPSPYLRKTFSLDKPIRRATVYSTALGLYELHLNGRKVSKDVFTPGWTDYNKRVQYQTYNVTDLLKQGKNAIGAILGYGWYAGNVGSFGPHQYGKKPYFLMQLNIEFKDGTKKSIVTNGTWQTSTGPILSSDIYMGEVYDARKELTGWDQPGYDDSKWLSPDIKDGYQGKIVAQASPTVQELKEIHPISVTEPKPGHYVFDMGQNMTGKVRLKVSGQAGQTVKLRHAVALNPDGTIYTANLRTAKQTDKYTLKGDGVETYEPHFTTHGFRYVEVTGYPGKPTLDSITGIVMHTAAPFTSQFKTSNDMINQLQSNITWSERDNFFSVPTDTPARDERLGWTGDINIFASTAAFNMNVAKFLGSKWLQDLRDAQTPDGAYPDVAPSVCCGRGTAGWGDAGVTVPYVIWQRYGDTRVIKQNYDAMANWIKYLKAHSTNYIRPAAGYGDWLNVNDPTPKDLIGTAYFAHSTQLLSEMAAAIGRDADAEQYQQLFEKIKAAFNKAYVSEDGRLQGDSQTAYVLALSMHLLPESKSQAAADRLVQLIKNRDWHLSTGFLGTRDLLPVLTKYGYLDVAYRLLLTDTYPSWLYEVKMGATTTWERWDGIKPDGSFESPSMNSFNHYAYGAVGNWMYRNMAGIKQDPNQPGYKHIIIHPRPGEGFTHIKGQYESVYGTIVSKWTKEGDKFKLHVKIPVNTTATVYLPADTKGAIIEGGQFAGQAKGVHFVKMENGNAVYHVGSGDYQFIVNPVLGKLSTALQKTLAFQDQVNQAKHPMKGQTKHLKVKIQELADQIRLSRSSYMDEDEALIKQVQHSLITTHQLQRWISKQNHIDNSLAQEWTGSVSKITNLLSEVSTKLFGIKLSIASSRETVLPGDTFTVKAALKNVGDANLNDIHFSTQAPEGWEITPQNSVSTGEIQPGKTASASFQLTVPADQAPAKLLEIEGQVSYKKFGGTAEVPLGTVVTVDSPISISSLKLNPDTIQPGDEMKLHVTIQNKGNSATEGSVKVAAPENWQVEPSDQTYSLKGGETKTIVFDVQSSPNASGSNAELQVKVTYNVNIGAQEDVPIPLHFINPPENYYDHVDVGDPASEQAHNFKASPASGTNVEAGLTRRYTSRGDANGYFQYDMKVEPGKPFIIRAVETYDHAQIKDYYVFVDGIKVYSRVNETTKGGVVTYQFVVDNVSVTEDGIATVRFQEDEAGRHYDPSIADVWTMPV